uniref:UDENN domain-containing protein n=1 Tax=Ditylenchus dipsaci TaxID=166011 RepID=A0A915DVG6_9BILA
MTSSRLRENVATYFDVCCEVHPSTADSPDRGANVKVLYPLEFNDPQLLRSIQQFCFPCTRDGEEGEAVQLFTFALTDAQSQYTFGFCRYTPGINTCLCILSGLSGIWSTHFYKFLNHLSNVLNNGTKEDLESLLTNAYHIDIQQYIANTSSGSPAKLTLNACTSIGKFSEEVPDDKKLPTLRHDKFMLEFYNAINERQMIPLLLVKRRIIFTSRKLSQLSSCVFAAARLLYPFHWQNLFIPILPKDLVDMLMAPMPYMIGVPKQTFRNLNRAELGAVVVVDLEEKTFESPDVDTLPPDALNFLRSQLKSSSEMFLSDGLARSFLQTNVLIFGKYTLGFVKNGSNSDLLWDRQVFVDNQRTSLQPFLNSLIGREGVQYFERFIEDRLKALNNGAPVDDEFDREIASINSKKIYDGYRNGHSSKPEAIHQAVNNVKDNATEVIGALKDRVQAISIKDKLGRFTPTEVRRRKLHPGKSKKKIDPLSVDAAHYDFNNPLANNKNSLSATNGDTPQSVSDAESVNSVLECDLIDFSSDFVPSPVNSLNTSGAGAPTTNTISPALDDLFGLNISNSHLPTSSQQVTSTRRTQWETFD